MTLPTPRALRAALVALALGVTALVVRDLRRAPQAEAPAATPTPTGAAGEVNRMQGFEYRGYKEDRETYVLRAERYEGQEQDQLRLGGVSMDFSYVSRGTPGRANIRSEQCTYTPSQQRAVFRGKVLLTTEDGFTLTTESLTYRGDRGLARSDEYVEFKRGRLSGSTTGMEYHAESGWLEMRSDAFLRIERETGPATEIRGGRARMDRGDDEMRFSDGARLVQGGDTLSADRLVLGFSWEEERLDRLMAVDDVVLDVAAGEPVPGTTGPTAARGPRRLTCERLEINFTPARTLRQAQASGGARLTLLPGPGEPAERRVLAAPGLTFQFNDAGQLERVLGGGSRGGEKGSSFESEPVDQRGAAPRRVRCHGFGAEIDPASGEPTRIDFREDVVFEDGTRRALGDAARYDGASGWLLLSKSPRLVDTQDGSELTARAIEVKTSSGDVRARGQVRHLLPQSAGDARRGWLAGDGQGGRVTAKSFEYEAGSRTATYREDALLSSGEDEVRAQEIRIREETGGRRRLLASGDVQSSLRPRASPEGTPPAPVQARAREMSYDEATQQVVYKGDVTLTQQEVVSRSPAATMTLSPDGASLIGVVAGEPVEVRQGERVASGTRLTYNPASQSMLLVGERVVLKDEGREVHGKSLTFHIGDDRILVDGLEQGRVETVLPKEPPKP
jgi:lipopolysaccharide transport protein LptA/LPS export ABC transporter protein LptC